MKFSLISPTFGRPEEVTEFLESLLEQKHSSFEVILGDGTPGDTLRPELERFYQNDTYPLKVVYEEYLPVSAARNRAAQEASGKYYIFLDSDCIIPPHYLVEVEKALQQKDWDAFGGPDAAHENFTNLQKAISYSMTSLFTTGGIRGKEKHVGDYHPRGFNMGIKAPVFAAVQGYSELRCGEDIDLSIRIIKAGYKVGFIRKAHVFHKRRTTLKQFFKQVYRFGVARINLRKRHPEQLQLTHAFPAAFLVGSAVSVLGFLLWQSEFFSALVALFFLYFALILLDSFRQNRNLAVAFYSVLTSITMLYGYGWGFIKNLLAWAASREVKV